MKKPSIQLLCLDIDGTLLDSHHRLPLENGKAVREAAQAGVTICLLSARPPSAVVPIVKELGINIEMACYNGGLLLYKQEKIYEERLSTDVGMRVILEAERCGVHLSVYRDWDWLIAEEDCWSAQESAITGVIPTVAPLRKQMNAWRDGPHKLLCMGKPHQIDAILAELEPLRLPAQMVRSKDTYLEILPLHAEKGMALQTICRTLGISPNQAMAIGDHDNDCGMLRAAGYGIAMGNGSETAKQAAIYQTRSNDEAGVAYAIYRWMLHEEGFYEAQ